MHPTTNILATVFSALLIGCGANVESLNADGAPPDSKDADDVAPRDDVLFGTDAAEAGAIDASIDAPTTDTGGGFEVTTIATEQPVPASIAVDGKQILWSCMGAGGSLRSASTSGGPATVLIDPLAAAGAIALAGSDVYAISNGVAESDGAIWYRRVAGTSGALMTGLVRPRGLTFDTGKLWFTVRSGDVYADLVSADPLSATRTTVLASVPHTVVFTVRDGVLFWADGDAAGPLRSRSALLTEPPTVLTDTPTPRAMTSDGDDLYFAPSGTSVRAVPVKGGAVVTVSAGHAAVTSVAANKDIVAWVDSGSPDSPTGAVFVLRKVDRKLFTVATGENFPTNVAVGTGSTLAWTSLRSGAVKTARWVE